MKMNADKILREYELVDRILSAYVDKFGETDKKSMRRLIETGHAAIYTGGLLETFGAQLTNGELAAEAIDSHTEDDLFATDISFPGGSLHQFKEKCKAGELRGENINRFLNRQEVESFMEENYDEIEVGNETYTVFHF